MTITETDTFPSPGGMQTWNPDFRTIQLKDIPEAIRYEQEWKPYGYTIGVLWREAGILFLYAAETKP